MKPFVTSCSTCGTALVVRLVRGRVRLFRRDGRGVDHDVGTNCPGCRKRLDLLLLDEIVSQTNRVP